MSNDLISRSALKKELAKNITIWTFNVSYDGILAEIIDNAPTIEPYSTYIISGKRFGKREEALKWLRPQGEWIEQTDFEGEIYYECSVCKEDWYAAEGSEMQGLMNYCPHCGAKMGGAT